MSEACSLCGDLGAAGTVVYDDERSAVLLHPDQSPRGHVMVVWKRHVENIAGLQLVEREHFIRVHAAAERSVLAVTGAERAILLKLGIQVPHLHVHIYPAATTDDRAAVMRMINGESREGSVPAAFASDLREAIEREI